MRYYDSLQYMRMVSVFTCNSQGGSLVLSNIIELAIFNQIRAGSPQNAREENIIFYGQNWEMTIDVGVEWRPRVETKPILNSQKTHCRPPVRSRRRRSYWKIIPGLFPMWIHVSRLPHQSFRINFESD